MGLMYLNEKTHAIQGHPLPLIVWVKSILDMPLVDDGLCS